MADEDMRMDEFLRFANRELETARNQLEVLQKEVDSWEHAISQFKLRRQKALYSAIHNVRDDGSWQDGFNPKAYVLDVLRERSDGVTPVMLRKMYEQAMGEAPSKNFPYNTLRTLVNQGGAVKHQERYFFPTHAPSEPVDPDDGPNAEREIRSFARVWCADHTQETYTNDDVGACYSDLSAERPDLLEFRPPSGLIEEREDFARAWIEEELEREGQLRTFSRKVADPRQ